MNLKKILMQGLILLTVPNTLFSQADSSRISFTQESYDSSDYSYHRKYQYLDINMKEEAKMFKIAVPTFEVTYFHNYNGSSLSKNNLGLLFSFERKINQSFSLYLENENNYSRTAYEHTNNYRFMSILNWGIRYYFLMEKRLAERTSGNNCNGVFVDFLVRGLNELNYSRVIVEESDLITKRTSSNFQFKAIDIPELRLNLGLQKRLNNFSYLDTRFYVSYIPEKNLYSVITPIKEGDSADLAGGYHKNPGHFTVGLDFKIGLAWGWK